MNYRRGNEGTVAAGASTTFVQLASAGQVTLTNTIAAVPLAPGQTQQESIVFPGINCDPDVFEVTATVTADSTNTVDEASETNNSGSRTIRPRMSGDLVPVEKRLRPGRVADTGRRLPRSPE